MPNYLINEIPNIENMSYLELGVFKSHHFSSIQVADKTSVDILHPADYAMSTDAFFEQVDPDKKWDVIYIDADHTFTSVWRDFNNSVKHLSPGGSIFLHDLHPDKEELTQPQFCGDAYKFLFQLEMTDYPRVFTMDADYGVTFVFDPQAGLNMTKNLAITYHEFVKWYANRKKLLTKAQMIECVKSYYNGYKK